MSAPAHIMDHDAVQLAIRARLLALVVCTTGSIALSVTSTPSGLAFTRATGSFIIDGFRRGMEVTSTGSYVHAANIGHGMITSLSALTMVVNMFVVTVVGGVQTITRPALVIEGSAGGRTLAVNTPSMAAWENVAPAGLSAFMAAAGIPYLEEEYSPSTGSVVTTPTMRARIMNVGDYILKWHGVIGIGSSTLRREGTALNALFAPGTSFVAGDNTVIISLDKQESQIVQSTDGPVLLHFIPWYVRSRNTIS